MYLPTSIVGDGAVKAMVTTGSDSEDEEPEAEELSEEEDSPDDSLEGELESWDEDASEAELEEDRFSSQPQEFKASNAVQARHNKTPFFMGTLYGTNRLAV